ncbi:extracellular solute-binding protein [Robertmurraya beringensis]|uniref:Extracellular solute-binding protein n=1 Tax=Robertmurraya beringensis TaxID=641660 RepID=A0ABV6KV33_9BACI
MKKISKFLSVALGLSMVLAGCSSKEETGGGVSGENEDGKKELVIWDWTDPYLDDKKKPMDIVMDSYQAENPNVELNIEKITNDSLRTKLMAAASANNLPDVAFLDGQWLAEFQAVGMLAPLTEYTDESGHASDYPEKVWDSVVFDGEVYGVPGDGDVRSLLYRTDLMEKAGLDPASPPKTWDELIDVSTKLMEAGKDEGVKYGFALNGGDSEHTSMRSLPWIWDMGGSFVDEEGQPALNSPEVVDTVQFMSDLVKKYKVSPSDSYLNKKVEVQGLVNSGQSAMAIVGSWEWRSDASFLAQEGLKGKLASAPIPVPNGEDPDKAATAVGYGVWVVFDHSKVKDEAWEWIEKVTSPEHQVNIFKDGTGNMPLRLSAYEDPIFTSDPVFQTFVDILPNAQPRPKTLNYELLSQSYRQAIQLVLSGEMTPQEALDEAQAKAEAEWKE